MNKIPDRWLDYSRFGGLIEGTRFLPFKVPLKNEMCRRAKIEKEKFTPSCLLTNFPKLGLVIDLTNTSRYYNPKEFTDNGVHYEKILCPGKQIPGSVNVTKFFNAVDEYLKNSINDERLIGVHCTHGLNRTSYFICSYMIQKMKIPAETAIKAFEEARGHQIERLPYVSHLKEKGGGGIIKNLYRNPQPDNINPQPDNRNPQPGNRNPQPDYRNPQPGYRNPQPDYRNPQPGYRNPQPDYRKPQQDYRNPQQDYRNPQPDYRNLHHDYRNLQLDNRNPRRPPNNRYENRRPVQNYQDRGQTNYRNRHFSTAPPPPNHYQGNYYDDLMKSSPRPPPPTRPPTQENRRPSSYQPNRQQYVRNPPSQRGFYRIPRRNDYENKEEKSGERS